MNPGSPETHAGMPMLVGVLESGQPLEPESILSFDRDEWDSPRQKMMAKLKSFRWPQEKIDDFLDRLGFE